MMTRSLPAFAFAAFLGISALTTSSDANALPGANVSCTTTADGFPVCVGTTDSGSGGYGPSDFLGAFPMSGGGWMEVYSDDAGVWWVEHNTNGSVTIGEEKTGGGAQKKKSANAIQNVPGTYTKSARAASTGAPTSAIKPNVALLKAQAAVATGSFATVTPSKPGVLMNGPAGSRNVSLNVGGNGSCSAIMLVTKDGKLVSSTGIIPMSFPHQRTIELPNEAGSYKVEFKGNKGCMPSKASTQLTVTPVAVMTGVILGAGR